MYIAWYANMLNFFLLKKCEKLLQQCKSYSYIYSAKNIRILYIESAKTVNEMTLNEVVKLTTFWTTGPWTLMKCKTFPSTNQIAWNVSLKSWSDKRVNKNANLLKNSLQLFPLIPQLYWLLISVLFACIVCLFVFLHSFADRREYSHNIFLISLRNIFCVYSLEAPHWSVSNKYSQHEQQSNSAFGWAMFLTFLYFHISIATCAFHLIHYENMPIQIYWKFTTKKGKISDKNSDIFSYFCSKHRLWGLVRTASARRF